MASDLRRYIDCNDCVDIGATWAHIPARQLKRPAGSGNSLPASSTGEIAPMTQTHDDIWTLLEQDAPHGCESVQDLYSWSLNYDAGAGPFALFLDLIGWSTDELGCD